MRRRHRLASLVLGPGLALVFVGQALGCYFPNEGALVVYTGNTSVAGGSSQVDLYLAAGPGSGKAIVHPLQLATNVAGSNDFFGWGTARGVGTGNTGITDCPDDYSAGWHVYADGFQFGDYWCRQLYGTLPNISTNQEFAFRRTTCPFNGFTRFVMYLNGTVKTCALINGSAGTLTAGGESVGTSATQDIDVDYEALHRYVGGVWSLWGAGHDTTCGPSSNDPPYFVTTISNSSFEIRSGI